MRVVFLVPRRSDAKQGGWRDKLWAYCRGHWEREFPDVPIFEGHHTKGLFNRAAAINQAARDAGNWDVAVVLDSDVICPPDQASQAITMAVEGGIACFAHVSWRGLTKAGTMAILRGQTVDTKLFTDRYVEFNQSCFLAVPRNVWDLVGGFDERFQGWGWEDTAFAAAVEVCDAPAMHVSGEILHLWHDRSPERLQRKDYGKVSCTVQYIENKILGQRYTDAVVLHRRFKCKHLMTLLLEGARECRA